MSDRYNREEERALASPLPLLDDAAVCDFGDCMQPAMYLLPGAFVCARCLAEHTLVTEHGPRYRVPIERLSLSLAGRERRRHEYQRLLDWLRAGDGGVVRSDAHEELLEDLISVAVDDLIRSLGREG